MPNSLPLPCRLPRGAERVLLPGRRLLSPACGCGCVRRGVTDGGPLARSCSKVSCCLLGSGSTLACLCMLLLGCSASCNGRQSLQKRGNVSLGACMMRRQDS